MTVETRPTRPRNPHPVADAEPPTPWAQHVLLYAAFFLMGAEMYLVAPMLPEIAESLHASVAASATIVTAYVLVYAVAGPPFGILADRYPRRWSILLGSLVFMLGNLACAVAGSLTMLVAGRGITGLGAAIAAPAIWAYLAERTPQHQRGRAIALGASVYSLGQVLGVPLGAALAALTTWRWPFLAVGLLMLVTSAVLYARLDQLPVRGQSRGLRALLAPWQQPRIGLGLIATLFLQAARLGAYTFVGVLYAQRFGFSLTQLGFVGLLVGAGSLVGSLSAGTILDRLHRFGGSGVWVSVLAAVAFVPCALVALTSHQIIVALVALTLWCVFGGAFYSSQQAYLSSADPTQRASVVAWNNSMMNAGIAVGTTLLGALTVGGTLFACGTAVLGIVAAVVSAALLALLRKDRQPA
ncbi:MFS transporter [Nocardia brasiliensis]|uniref:MFS transporter n=1 Tax=Nocardia brasiliensis TaxID=37326 RepID=A0A6G9XQP6_NOCBR|nr:MFS transporter [Nocardia brasiliensis]QIS03153.1 MFS transporter [Nocardia brasiliensis]